MKLETRRILGLAAMLAGGFGCSDGNEADRIGIAGECSKDGDCRKVGDIQLACLTGFKGGYCGLAGCLQDADCPESSVCVAEGGVNYCFRVCTDKVECNANRTVANEANCVSSGTHVGVSTAKVCVPPSGS